MSAVRCKVCECAIRGNAAQEEYDETAQEYRYTCKRCNATFARVACETCDGRGEIYSNNAWMRCPAHCGPLRAAGGE